MTHQFHLDRITEACCLLFVGDSSSQTESSQQVLRCKLRLIRLFVKTRAFPPPCFWCWCSPKCLLMTGTGMEGAGSLVSLLPVYDLGFFWHILTISVYKVPFTSSVLCVAFELARWDSCRGIYAKIIAAHGNISAVSSLKYFANNQRHVSPNLFKICRNQQVSICGNEQGNWTGFLQGLQTSCRILEPSKDIRMIHKWLQWKLR